MKSAVITYCVLLVCSYLADAIPQLEDYARYRSYQTAGVPLDTFSQQNAYTNTHSNLEVGPNPVYHEPLYNEPHEQLTGYERYVPNQENYVQQIPTQGPIQEPIHREQINERFPNNIRPLNTYQIPVEVQHRPLENSYTESVYNSIPLQRQYGYQHNVIKPQYEQQEVPQVRTVPNTYNLPQQYEVIHGIPVQPTPPVHTVETVPPVHPLNIRENIPVTHQGYNIQPVIPHTDIKEIPVSAVKKHYLVIYPNGTVEKVENIEHVTQNYPNYVFWNSPTHPAVPLSSVPDAAKYPGAPEAYSTSVASIPPELALAYARTLTPTTSTPSPNNAITPASQPWLITAEAKSTLNSTTPSPSTTPVAPTSTVVPTTTPKPTSTTTQPTTTSTLPTTTSTLPTTTSTLPTIKTSTVTPTTTTTTTTTPVPTTTTTTTTTPVPPTTTTTTTTLAPTTTTTTTPAPLITTTTTTTPAPTITTTTPVPIIISPITEPYQASETTTNVVQEKEGVFQIDVENVNSSDEPNIWLRTNDPEFWKKVNDNEEPLDVAYFFHIKTQPFIERDTTRTIYPNGTIIEVTEMKMKETGDVRKIKKIYGYQ